MTDPTQAVNVRRIYYASGTPPVPPVLYDNAYDSQPNVDVLDAVLEYNGQISVEGYVWNGVQQSLIDPGDTLRASAVAYWKMDNLVDSTGRGNTLTNNNIATFVPGKIGNCVSLIGTIENPQYLSRLHNDDLSYYGRTLYACCWVKLNSLGSKFVVNKWQDGGDEEYSMEVTEVTPEHFQFAISAGNNGWAIAETFGDIEIDTWYFVEIYTDYDSDIAAVAVNNSSFDTGIMEGEFETSVHFIVGTHSSTPLDGFVDELLVMHRIPTAQERAYLYNSGAGITLYP